jgi:putative SOS response-associated peptidase YedK
LDQGKLTEAQAVNATAERVASAPMFRSAYAKRRCIVPIDNFFEWKAIRGSKTKQPHAIGLKTDEPFGIASIWESWKHPATGIVHRTFCVIITTANELVSKIHDRMPVILPPETYDR